MNEKESKVVSELQKTSEELRKRKVICLKLKLALARIEATPENLEERIQCHRCNREVVKERAEQMKQTRTARHSEEALDIADSCDAITEVVARDCSELIFKKTPLTQSSINESRGARTSAQRRKKHYCNSLRQSTHQPPH